MYPYIQIGSVNIPTYAIIIFAAYIIGLYIAGFNGEKYGIPKKYLYSSGAFIALGTIIGAKLLFFLTKLPSFIAEYQDKYQYLDYYEKLSYLAGGFVFYGGLIGAIAGLLIFCKSFCFDFYSYVASLTPIIPFVHSLGRIGCVFAGCCYGIEYHGIFAIVLDNVERFPVQLLESVINMILFIVLQIYVNKFTPYGKTTLGIYLTVYSIVRFILEFLRGDQVRGIFFHLSTSQWISIILLIAGIVIIKQQKTVKKQQ